MAATPYKATTWGDEPISKDKLNQMSNNDQWIYENMPKMLFNTYGIKRTNGVKILAGIAVVPAAAASSASVTVSFGTFFSSGCKPVIVTGTQPTSGAARFHTAFKGIDGFYPDHRGAVFIAGADSLNIKANVMSAKVYIHFVAIGW